MQGSILVDCGAATTHTENNEEYFINIDKSFDPTKYFIELANGEKSDNVAKKKGTVVIYLHLTEVKILLKNT